jgi:WD40 repeat protein
MSYIDLKERCIPYRWKNYHAMDGGEKTAETVRPLCFSPDGKTVLSQKAKGRMHRGAALCDVGTVKIKSEIPNVMRIISAAFTPDGTRLVLLDDSDRIEDPHPRQIYCWDMETKKEVWRKSASAYRAPSLQFDRIVVGPNGDVALLVNQTFPGGMALISTKTGERTSVFSTGGAFPESGNFSVPKTRQ